MLFSVSIKCTALCTRCFLYTQSQHFMLPKSRGYNMLVQFGVQSLSFTFLRNNISCGQVAQVSTDNKMFLSCPSMRHPLLLKGLWKWSCSTTISYLHFILQEFFFFTFLIHCGFCDFQPWSEPVFTAMTVHIYSRIVILAMTPFHTWQDRPFIVNVLHGKQLRKRCGMSVVYVPWLICYE